MMDEIDVDDLRREAAAIRWHQQQLMEHPDCRDPDHPGCEKCMVDDDDHDEDDDYQSQTYGGK